MPEPQAQFAACNGAPIKRSQRGDGAKQIPLLVLESPLVLSISQRAQPVVAWEKSTGTYHQKEKYNVKK